MFLLSSTNDSNESVLMSCEKVVCVLWSFWNEMFSLMFPEKLVVKTLACSDNFGLDQNPTFPWLKNSKKISSFSDKNSIFGSADKMTFSHKVLLILSKASLTFFFQKIGQEKRSKASLWPYPHTSKKTNSFSRELMLFIIRAMHCPSIVDNPHFIRFVRHLDPRITIPCRRTITHSLLPEIYNETVNKLK